MHGHFVCQNGPYDVTDVFVHVGDVRVLMYYT